MYRPFAALRVITIALAAMLLVAGAGAAGAAPSEAGGVASCRVLAADVFLRIGPGTAYPAVGKFIQGTVLQGITFVKIGVPGGSWVEVQQTPGRSLGFLPADAQTVACQPAASTLTPGQIPPVPQTTDERVSRTRVNGGDLSNNPVVRGPANVNNGQYIIIPRADQKLIEDVLDANGQIRFGDGLGFGVEPLDRRAGQAIGAGIQQVEFKIKYVDDNGDEVVAYDTIERNAPYCLFSDENGQCNVLRFSRMGYKWPDTQLARGAPRPDFDTSYTAEITIFPKQGNPILWRWGFELAAIAVELP